MQFQIRQWKATQMLIQSQQSSLIGFIGQAGKSAALGCWNVDSFLRCLTWNSILCGIYLYVAEAATAACHYYFFHRSLGQNKRPRSFSAPSRHLVINQKGRDVTSAPGHVFQGALWLAGKSKNAGLGSRRSWGVLIVETNGQSWSHGTFWGPWPPDPSNLPWWPPCKIPHTRTHTNWLLKELTHSWSVTLPPVACRDELSLDSLCMWPPPPSCGFSSVPDFFPFLIF